MAVITIDLTSINVTSAVISMAGKVMKKESLSIEGKHGEQVSLLIQNQIKKLLNLFENEPIQIKAVGVSVPGICYSKTGLVWAPNIPGWDNYPLLQDISYLLRGKNIRIKIDNNRTCCILGEHWQGAAKETKNAVYLAVGSGIGAGILIDGKILHGFNDAVGAIGWFAVDRTYRDSYSEKGCLESLASGKGIIIRVKEALNITEDYLGYFKDIKIQNLVIGDVFEAYKQKDPIAQKIIKESVELWGITAANIISAFNPEILIFGGGVFGPGIFFIDEIKSEAKKWAQPLSIDKVKFSPSQLGNNAGLFGAGHLALGRF